MTQSRVVSSGIPRESGNLVVNQDVRLMMRLICEMRSDQFSDWSCSGKARLKAQGRGATDDGKEISRRRPSPLILNKGCLCTLIRTYPFPDHESSERGRCQRTAAGNVDPTRVALLFSLSVLISRALQSAQKRNRLKVIVVEAYDAE